MLLVFNLSFASCAYIWHVFLYFDTLFSVGSLILISLACSLYNWKVSIVDLVQKPFSLTLILILTIELNLLKFNLETYKFTLCFVKVTLFSKMPLALHIREHSITSAKTGCHSRSILLCSTSRIYAILGVQLHPAWKATIMFSSRILSSDAFIYLKWWKGLHYFGRINFAKSTRK